MSLDDKLMHDKITLVYNKVFSFYGVLPGICNIIEGDIEGASISGLTVVGGDAKGFYLSAIGTQINGNAEGVYTGLCNDVNGNAQGLFVGALNRAGKLKAAKIKIKGYEITLPAMQIGFVNYARNAEGAYMQVGAVNIVGKRLGLLFTCGIGYDIDLDALFFGRKK